MLLIGLISDFSSEVRPRATSAFYTSSAFALGRAAGIGQPWEALLAKEMSCSRYVRWAVVDNFVEKILQGLILNKKDISTEEIAFCKGMMRQMPAGRSFLLNKTWGLKKIYAARGLVLTAEMLLNKAFQIFIGASLSYRLYEWLTTGTKNFSEFETLLEANSQKGVSSLVQLLAKFDPEWLYLLLTSPVIVGGVKRTVGH